MYLGADEISPVIVTQPAESEPQEEPQEDPWYARPSTAILNWLGNITYATDDYTIRTVDGALVVDRRAPTPAAPVAPAAAQPATLMQSIGRVPPLVWLGVGGLVLLAMWGRK